MPLFIKKKKRVEFFDSSGDEFSTVSSRHRYPQRILDFTIWDSHTYQCYMNLLLTHFNKEFPGFYISRVCNTNLQKIKEDHFCHTWMYYYFYKRLIENKEPWKLMNYLKRTISSKERLEEIKNFHHFLLYFKE